MSKRSMIFLLVLVSACSSDSIGAPESTAVFAASDNANTLRVETFDVPPTSCNAFNNGAIAMSFRVNGIASANCAVGVGGPGDGNAGGILFPHVEGGSVGVLTITFARPTRTVEFDLSQSFINAQPRIAVVKLFKPGAGVLRQETELVMTKDPLYVSGRFAYTGGAVQAVEISFVSTGFSRFALDNLAYFGKQ